MAPIMACYVHSDYPRQGCPDCHALRSSVALRVIQGDLDEARRRFNIDTVMEEVERHLRGEVDAT